MLTTEAKKRLENQFGVQFQVIITMHTADAIQILETPQIVRDIIGAAIESIQLQEEIDFTLEVTRKY